MNSQETGIEFPRHLVPVLRCSRDSGELICREVRRSGDIGLIDAVLRCSTCSEEYYIDNGIACLLKGAMTSESLHEMTLRDLEYKEMSEAFVPPTDDWWRSEYLDAIEIPPHMRELGPLNGHRVLELGCGDGRFTILMAQQGAEVLAVDFSMAALRKLAIRLSTGVAPITFQMVPLHPVDAVRERVGLVQADASQFRAAPGSFDRALSASPLDSRDERMGMYRAVAESLKDDGRYVAGVEHDDLLRRMMGMPVARRYSPGGIFIEHFDIATLRREAAPYFSRLRIQPIRARIPSVIRKRLPLKLAIFLSLAVTRIPVLQQFGEILLLRAERPLRPPRESVRRSGCPAAKSAFRWYRRWKGKENIWDGEPV